MKSVDIVGADDPRILIRFNVPTVGELALPRLDFIDETELDEIQSAIEALDPDLAPHRAQRQAYLIQLKPFCTDEQFQAAEKLKLGELTQITDTWTKRSALPLGEFLASDDSSTENTGRPSRRTSSNKAGAESTSDDG